VLDWAQARDIVVSALLSPVAYNGDPPQDRSFGALNQTSDTRNIGDAIQGMVAAFGVSPTGLLVWSTSGGSWFLTSSFFPVLGAEFQGLFAISCGGSTFRFSYAWDPAALPATATKLNLWFNYGSLDFLAPGVEDSRDHYLAQGFVVSETRHEGASHCAHDIVSPTLSFWQANL
jgi:hypothetical protein